MLKGFNELRELDLSQYIKKRDGADYLPWAVCVDLLHQHGAEYVDFEPLTNANGSSLFMSEKTFTDKNGNTNNCYEVAVKVTIDDLQFVQREPLMNGSNPVKDNSLTQQRLGNAQKRAFVKGVAIRTGLGFGLWSEDIDDITDVADDLSKHSLKAIKERILEKVTTLMKQGISEDEIAQRNNMTIEEMKGLFSYFTSINRFERTLNDMLNGNDSK
jgi:hypothetical protein